MTFEEIRAGLEDREDVERRRRAVLALLGSKAAEARELVILALGDEEWRVRKEASRVAASLAADHALVADLIQAVSQGENIGLRSAAIEALGLLGPEVAQEVVRALDEVPEQGRKFIIAALGEVGGEVAVPALAEAASSGDVNLVAAAVEALARIGGDSAVVALRKSLGSGDSYIRLAALDGLDRLGAKIPFEELEHLASDRLLRRTALRALGRSEDVRALAILHQALDDPSPHVVGSAAASLYLLCRDVPDGTVELASMMEGLSVDSRKTLKRLVREGDLNTRRGAALISLLAREADNLPEIVDLAAREAVPQPLAGAFRRWGRDSVPPLLSVHEEAVGARQAVALELAAELAADADQSPEDDAIRQALRRGLRHEDMSVQVAAARGLSTFATADDVGRLVAVAAGGPDEVARAAGKALEALRVREPDAVEEALARVELDGPGGAALTRLVGEVSGEDGVTRLSAALSADDPRTRIAAIAAFVDLGGSRAAEQVCLALADEDIDVQAAAAHALGEIRDDEGAPVGARELLLTLESAEPTVVAAAARALARSGEVRATEPLKELLREGSPGVALAAIEGLRALADPVMGDMLVEALGHPDEEVVKEVLSAIAESRGERTVSRLAVGLSHHAWDVRRHAALLLAAHGGKDARAALEQRAGVEDDELVKEALDRALEESP